MHVKTGSVHVESNNGIILSSKNDPNNHGYRLKNIKNAIRHYNGSIEISYTDFSFRLSIFYQYLTQNKANAGGMVKIIEPWIMAVLRNQKIQENLYLVTSLINKFTLIISTVNK